MYGDSHVKDKTVARPSYLLHGDPYTGNTTRLYLDGPLVPLTGSSKEFCSWVWKRGKDNHVGMFSLWLAHNELISQVILKSYNTATCMQLGRVS